MGEGRDLDKFEKIQAENTKRAKKNFEKKLKRLRYKEELKRLENKKKAKKNSNSSQNSSHIIQK